MEIEKDRLKKLFPNLAEEVFRGESKVRIDASSVDTADGDKAAIRRFAGFSATVIDFVRRCDTEEEAKEIISFMEKRNEISGEYAAEIWEKIKKEGLRGLGPKKNRGFYEEEDKPQP